MIKIDSDFLEQVGLGSLSDDEKNDAIEQIIATLQERVGDRAIDVLIDEQVDVLEDKFVNGTVEENSEWLQKNVPNYQGIVNEELEKIKNEVKSQGISVLAKQDTAQVE